MALDITGYKKFEQDSRLMKRILFLEQEWQRAYPSVDLQKQLGWAHAWLVSNSKKYSDMTRFLNNWFRRCQQDIDRLGLSTNPIQMPQKFQETLPQEHDVMDASDFQKMREALYVPKRTTLDTL